MKLEPRERRVSSDYLLDNAAALKLGSLYLGWNSKASRKSSKKKKKADPAPLQHVSPPKVKVQPKKVIAKVAKQSVKKPTPKKRSFAQRAPKRPVVIPQPIPTPALPSEVQTDERIEITVCFVNGDAFSVSSSKMCTVRELKRQIESACPLPDSNPLLLVNGGPLRDDDGYIGQLGVSNGSVVYCIPQ